jgi:hypothetical protein
MKILILTLSSVLFFTVNAFAQQESPSATPSVASDIKSAREVLKSVVVTNEGSKTFADVLDKGLDLFTVYATSLSDMLKKIAPEVFKIMVRQQYAEAIGSIFLWIFLPCLVFSFPFAFRRMMYGKDSDAKILSSPDYEEFHVVISWAIITLGFILSMIGLLNISESVIILINPEYYAIKDMIEMIK